MHGTGPALAWIGTPSYGVGAFGELPSFNFDGTNGLDGGTTLGNIGGDAFYLSFDVKTTANGPLPSQLISKRQTCPSSMGFLDINMHADGTIEAQYSASPTDNYVLHSTTPVNDGNWHTIAVADYASGFRLLVDGQQQAMAVALPVPNVTNTGPFSVAKGDACQLGGFRQPLVGLIDNIYLADLTNGDTMPVDVSASQVSVPTVAAGSSGSFDVDLTNPGAAAVATTVDLTPPAGVTFTGVSEAGGQCGIIASGHVFCQPNKALLPLDPARPRSPWTSPPTRTPRPVAP